MIHHFYLLVRSGYTKLTSTVFPLQNTLSIKHLHSTFTLAVCQASFQRGRCRVKVALHHTYIILAQVTSWYRWTSIGPGLRRQARRARQIVCHFFKMEKRNETHSLSLVLTLALTPTLTRGSHLYVLCRSVLIRIKLNQAIKAHFETRSR